MAANRGSFALGAGAESSSCHWASTASAPVARGEWREAPSRASGASVGWLVLTGLVMASSVELAANLFYQIYGELQEYGV